MPCVTMSPAIHMPRATFEPKEPAAASSSTVSTSVYERLWRFLLHHLQAQPAALTQETKPRRRSASRLSAASEMRCRVRMLHELETQPRDGDDATHSHSQSHTQNHSHHRNAMQTTCANCGQLFFRDLGMAPSPCDAASSPSAYCSLDCRSSYEYRNAIQHAVDRHAAFDDSMSSRL